MSEDQSRGRRRTYGQRSPTSEPSAKVVKDEGKSSTLQASGSFHTDAQPSTSRAATQSMRSHPASQAVAPARNRYADRYEIVNTRPADLTNKQGTEGERIRLLTNFFRLTKTPKWRIFQYHVDFVPDIEMPRVRGGILSEHKNILGNGYVFDGKQLFTIRKLEQDSVTLKGISKNGIDYAINMKLVGVVSATDSRFLQVLNLVLRRSMKGLKLELVGRNLYDAQAKIQLREHHLELWPGYETSIRQHERDILLCTEITHKVMRTETVYDILLKTSRNPAHHQENFKNDVLGLIVLTDYNNHTYCINDVDFGQTPKSTFSCKGKDVSFLEYYKTKYNISLRDHKQPLLISKHRTKAQATNANDIVILIPELCRVTGLTDPMRANFVLMKAMGEHTRMNPVRRIQRLRTLNQRLQHTPESVQVLSDWDLNLEQQFTEVEGRLIDTQEIIFKSNKASAGSKANWTREFHNKHMFTAPSRGLDRWAVIAPHRNARELRNLLDSLYRVATGMNLIIRQPTEFKISDDRTGSYIKALDECACMDPQLILILVPNNNVERYSSIKKRCYVERAIPSQVVTLRVANNRNLASIATKIAIQLNCKLGYTPWMVQIPLSGLMTIGFDIAKCSRDRAKAYGAMVASMDLQQNATFFSTVAECNAYDVLANNLWLMMVKALRQYRQEHGELPKRILFYRDGVGSGSLKQLFDYEVKEIVEKIDEEYKRAGASAPPKLAYIVVTKFTKTRLFTSSSENPPPGTVVDDVVTLPECYDFYLVSQAVNQGTVSPTNYNVLYSNIGLSPDRIQKLTFKMCHLYYNWSGTTRVPAVCQYAKKLATLVGTNLHNIPQSALEKKFFYL